LRTEQKVADLYRADSRDASVGFRKKKKKKKTTIKRIKFLRSTLS